MNIALWIIAGLLACVFLAGGVQKVVRPPALEPLGDRAVRWIGVAEIAAAAGLILPAVLDLVPVLVPLAATGVVLLMVAATVFHIRLGEFRALAVTVTLAALALVVAVGRFGPETFSA